MSKETIKLVIMHTGNTRPVVTLDFFTIENAKHFLHAFKTTLQTTEVYTEEGTYKQRGSRFAYMWEMFCRHWRKDPLLITFILKEAGEADDMTRMRVDRTKLCGHNPEKQNLSVRQWRKIRRDKNKAIKHAIK